MTKKHRIMQWFRYGIIAAMIIAITTYACWPTPYIIYRPGSAEEVGPMVHIEDAHPDDTGTFLLTTVNVVTKTNKAMYWYTKWFNKHAQFFQSEEIFRKGETQEEYRERQGFNMMNSQSMAALAAYKAANVPFELLTDHVIVLGVQKGFPAEKSLAAGDKLMRVNGKEVVDTQMVAALIQQHRVGEAVTITYERDAEIHEAQLELVELDENAESSRPGIGVIMGNVMDVVPADPGKRVTIDAGNIGGPSAGLMFALEIYSQLVPENVTKGYRIAGTGEMNGNGDVGLIGGVRHKVIAADRKKADVFFCPSANGAEALEAAEMIGTKMQIVPVSTMAEALDYLSQLPAKDT